MKQINFKIDTIKELTGNQVMESMARNNQIKFQQETNKMLSEELQMENNRKRQNQIIEEIFG